MVFRGVMCPDKPGKLPRLRLALLFCIWTDDVLVVSLRSGAGAGATVELHVDPSRSRAVRFCTAVIQASGQLVPLNARCWSICTLRSARRSAVSRANCPSEAANTTMNTLIHTAQVKEGHTSGVLSYPFWPGEPSKAPNPLSALCNVLMMDLEAEMHLWSAALYAEFFFDVASTER